MVRTIDDVSVTDVEKRKIPTKHYSKIMEMFPEEAGAVDPQTRIIPFLPGKKFFGRSHIREVAVKRMAPIALYCRAIIKLPKKISQCREVTEFFEMESEDIEPPKYRKKASIKGNKISMPKVLEQYVCVTEYRKQEKGEVSLTVGMQAEVAEKTETGWWFVHAEEEQGWVPSTCLERADGTKEDTTTKFKSGEEVYLCTEEFVPQGEDELAMDRGAVVDVIEKNLEGWWLVRYNGREGYVPATYLIKSDAFNKKNQKLKPKKQHPVPQPPKPQPATLGGPEIIKSLVEISDLLKEDEPPDDRDDEDEGGDYDVPDEDKIYTVHELSRILKEDNRGSSETEMIYGKIENLKSRSLTRGGSTRPPPRPVFQPKFPTKSRTPPVRLESVSKEYVTIASFNDSVGDGISFEAGQLVKVLDKNEGGWWFVEIGGQEGWAPADYIQQNVTALAQPRAPSPEAVPIINHKSRARSREDLSERDEWASESSQNHPSGIGGLADALKAKLATKNSPPAPPKKENVSITSIKNNNTNSDISTTGKAAVKAVPKHTNTNSGAFRLPKNLMTDNDNKQPNTVTNIALKPITKNTKNKSPSRSSQPPPPMPPTKSGATEPKQAANKPLPPYKAKGDFAKKTDISKTSVPLFNKSETEEPKLNVAGLAGALKAKFESQSAGSDGANKPIHPSVSNKPIPPSLSNKQPAPSTSNKPALPSTLNKPSMHMAANKPTLPSAFSKPATPNKVSGPPSTTQKLKTNLGGAKPKPPETGATKPPWLRKPETDSSESNIDSGTKVSDLANVLKSRFEKHKNDADDSSVPDSQTNLRKGNLPTPPTTSTKPGGGVKPKPTRPSSPPVTHAKSHFSPGASGAGDNMPNMFGAKIKQELDPGKYSSRPLPVKPPGGRVMADTGSSETNHSKLKSETTVKSIPSLPVKPNKPLPAAGAKPKQQSKTTHLQMGQSSDSECRPGGVAGIANALKAKLEGQFGGNTVTMGNKSPDQVKPKTATTQKPKGMLMQESTNVKDLNSEINNNGLNENFPLNPNTDNIFNAIADYNCENDGEVSLKVGQQVEVLDKADGWWLVRYESTEGWAPSAYLEQAGSTDIHNVPDSTRNTDTQSVSTNQIVYRTCTHFTSENKGEISFEAGEEVTVLDSSDEGWWMVQIGANEGWAPAAYLQEFTV